MGLCFFPSPLGPRTPTLGIYGHKSLENYWLWREKGRFLVPTGQQLIFFFFETNSFRLLVERSTSFLATLKTRNHEGASQTSSSRPSCMCSR